DVVKLGFDAPPEISIHRQEVYERILRSQQRDAAPGGSPPGGAVPSGATPPPAPPEGAPPGPPEPSAPPTEPPKP
ncbi:MAG: carbon storage regulator, partial [Gemmatales bacterium]|nr:carbon storage regulator [Gemmatales bacterium]